MAGIEAVVVFWDAGQSLEPALISTLHRQPSAKGEVLSCKYAVSVLSTPRVGERQAVLERVAKRMEVRRQSTVLDRYLQLHIGRQWSADSGTHVGVTFS